MKKYVFAFFCLLFSFSIESQDISYKQHQELGNVQWLRSYDVALKEAKESDLPILILFQEVPGCATCRNYGNGVLTHPLIVDAIENEFVPLCIFNNKGGKDRKVLEKYNEPTWNNPVVRIVNSKGKDLITRVSGNYTEQGIVAAMNTALTESGKLVPKYLLLLEEDLGSVNEECYLSMYCFWTGEKEIANIDGVVGTQAGFMNGKEVVKVTYDKHRTNPKSIKRNASKKSCGDKLFLENTNYRIDQESKYYLQHSLLKHVPMTPFQATKINRSLAMKENPLVFLSPSQLRLYHNVKNDNGKGYDNYIEKDFLKSWKKMNRS